MTEDRYKTVEQSIIEACKEVREMRAGRLPEREWREVFTELKAELFAEENQASEGNIISHKKMTQAV